MKRSESSIERSVCKKAFEKYGVRHRKLNGMGARDWPDQLFLWKGKGILFIEFKAPDKEASEAQANNHKMLREMGFQVEVHDDVDTALAAIYAAYLSEDRR
jgi:hypothetical protein